ncbi:MAG: hypothetical protein RMK29_18885 [Myxococcales bacterium]|nr:hypothetical protein [Myxococcota bacterium]MDW8283774.1 hypothetical protein [Myxococcales bacterium]
MRLHPTIILTCIWLLGCGAPYPQEVPPQNGRVALSWTLDGAFLTTERCQAERIEFMEVEVRSLTGPAQIGFTHVQCDLDRYSIAMAPLGRVLLRVGALGRDARGAPCLRRYGEATAVAGTAYPDRPTRVELSVRSDGCR